MRAHGDLACLPLSIADHRYSRISYRLGYDVITQTSHRSARVTMVVLCIKPSKVIASRDWAGAQQARSRSRSVSGSHHRQNRHLHRSRFATAPIPYLCAHLHAECRRTRGSTKLSPSPACTARDVGYRQYYGGHDHRISPWHAAPTFTAPSANGWLTGITLLAPGQINGCCRYVRRLPHHRRRRAARHRGPDRGAVAADHAAV